MEVKLIEIKQIDPKTLSPYENNAKKHEPKQISNIAKSIKKYGFKQPVLIDSNNIIIAGHGRVLGALKLKLESVPCLVADDLTEDEIKEYRILDNKLNESEWDFSLLEDELANLDFSEFELDFDFEVEEEDPEVVEDDFDVDEALDEQEEPTAKMGDIWQLGRHRLICGDSTDNGTIKRLMGGKKADITFTDPPYNMEVKGGCKGSIAKGLRKQEKDIEFISNFEPRDFLNVLPTLFNKNMNAYIFCNKDLLPEYLNWAVQNKYSFNILIWKKPNAIPIGDSHRPDIEYLLLFRKNAIWNNAVKGVNYSRCLEYGREKGLHPTMKPLELIGNELKISSNKNSIVVDVFGGSGSTLIACEQTDRTCYMCELEPKYVDVIIKRWQQFTGETAVLID